MNRPPLPFFLPLIAVLFVVIWGGGLGVIFIVLNESGMGIWGVIGLGLVLVIGVPGIASLLTLRRN